MTCDLTDPMQFHYWTHPHLIWSCILKGLCLISKTQCIRFCLYLFNNNTATSQKSTSVWRTRPVLQILEPALPMPKKTTISRLGLSLLLQKLATLLHHILSSVYNAIIWIACFLTFVKTAKIVDLKNSDIICTMLNITNHRQRGYISVQQYR